MSHISAFSSAEPLHRVDEGPRGLSFLDLRYPFPVEFLRLSCGRVAFTQALPPQRENDGLTTLLLLHGLGSYMPAWSKVIPLLSQTYRVVAMDLPGFGKSDKGDHPYSMSFFAEVVEEACQALHLDRVVLCGHSMGGQIAMTHALHHPERSHALILFAPAGLERFSETEAAWLRLAISQESVLGTREPAIHNNLAANFYQMPPDAWFMVADRLAIMGGPEFLPYARAVARSLAGMLAGPIYDSLPRLTVPTLLLFGEEDRFIPNPVLHKGSTRDLALLGASRIPRCQLRLFADTGHMLQFERPETCAAQMLGFLELLQGDAA